VSRRRPGRLWLFFYGRKRRGFPGLLVALVVAVIVLGALYGLPHGAELSRFVIVLTVSALVLVILAAIVLVAIAAIRPPRRGRR
jgi:nitrogen fixation/metabolism regulation signal transduction histidine kinase